MSYTQRQADLANAKQEKAREQMRVCASVRVLAFNAQNMTVDVQPINKKEIDGQYANASPLMGIPVASLCSGEFTIRPWYKRGDTGIVIFADEDIDAAMDGGGAVVEPNTKRNHAPEDGFFIGGLSLNGKAPKGLPDNAVVVAAGSTYMAVASGGIKVRGNLDVTGTLTAGGINLNTHTHGGVEPGGGSTSGPR